MARFGCGGPRYCSGCDQIHGGRDAATGAEGGAESLSRGQDPMLHVLSFRVVAWSVEHVDQLAAAEILLKRRLALRLGAAGIPRSLKQPH